jgi:predicted unusual protein kinase regulating ubiquinone biosynthesis (AarF/ABC1/UbiB family)
MPDSNNPGFASTLSDQTGIPPRTESGGAAQAAFDPSQIPINWRRYQRTLWYAGWLFLRVVFWEILVRRLVGNAAAGNRPARWRRWAREFRALAVNMGGVMIKLGQFISVRADILPPEITEELASLQDEVPTVPFRAIRKVIEADLGPLDRHFASFEETPVAAASLGQAHRARLLDGQRVVVKVQRPGIQTLVNTDLRALDAVARGLMRFRFVSRRANLPVLLGEFSEGLWQELDYTHEADNAEAFGVLFKGNMGVYVPAVYRELSTRRVLALEDVTSIKVTDAARFEAAGISRQDVARRLVSTYLEMVFTEKVFHGDPHPGNLFVYPFPTPVDAPTGRHADGQALQGEPFYLIFVDFGLVGHVTPHIVAGLRETLIALIQRDAKRLVRSYQQLGILLPDADTSRIEEATQGVFDRVWGMNLSQLGDMPLSEMQYITREFNDLLFALPFQVPQDFLYLSRAIGLLIGICTALDPEFNPWQEVQPFAKRMLHENGELADGLGLPTGPRSLLKALLSGQALDMVGLTRAIQMPARADGVLRRMDQGDLAMRTVPSPELQHDLDRIAGLLQRVLYAVVFAALLICTTLLYTSGSLWLSIVSLLFTGLAFLRLVFAGGSHSTNRV